MKVMLHPTLFLILLSSAVVQHLNFLHGKDVVQCLLNYRDRLPRRHFEKLLQSSTKESKNYNPSTACIILTNR